MEMHKPIVVDSLLHGNDTSSVKPYPNRRK